MYKILLAAAVAALVAGPAWAQTSDGLPKKDTTINTATPGSPIKDGVDNFVPGVPIKDGIDNNLVPGVPIKDGIDNNLKPVAPAGPAKR